MQAINLNDIETIEIQSELDPGMRVRVGFPISSATGTAVFISGPFQISFFLKSLRWLSWPAITETLNNAIAAILTPPHVARRTATRLRRAT